MPCKSSDDVAMAIQDMNYRNGKYGSRPHAVSNDDSSKNTPGWAAGWEAVQLLHATAAIFAVVAVTAAVVTPSRRAPAGNTTSVWQEKAESFATDELCQ